MSVSGYHRWLADENFPLTSYQILLDNGFDIIHIALIAFGIDDVDVITLSQTGQRIILTFDSDFGTLIFKSGYRPLGVIFFRLPECDVDEPTQIVLKLLKTDINIIGYLTVIDRENIRQRQIS